MTFDEKVKTIRALPFFKVAPIAEVRSVALAAKESKNPTESDYILTKISPEINLILTTEDINKISREYPDVEAKLTPKSTRQT